MKNFNNKLKEILFVSKITEIKNKKLTVSFYFLTNIGVLSDILIIVIFASFFKNDSISSNLLFNFLLKGVIYSNNYRFKVSLYLFRQNDTAKLAVEC